MIGFTRRRRTVAVALVALLSACPEPASAYLKLGYDLRGTTTSLRWTQLPVRYYIADRGVEQVAPDDLQAAVARATSTWQQVSTSGVTFEFAGFTGAPPADGDGVTTIGFVDQASLDRVLATTSFTVDDTTGTIVEADIVLNASFPWSVAAGGESGRYDLESIVLHELGHVTGLGHSALGETELRADGTRRVIASAAVMFPIAFTAGNISGRKLQNDDIAGVSDLYPANGFNDQTGSISGRVTKNGSGIFGAHVIAFNPDTGSLIANFSLNSRGQFSIAGLSPGPWLVRVEPLDDADVSSFFTPSNSVDLQFVATFYDRAVVVPRGGDSGAIEVHVTPK